MSEIVEYNIELVDENENLIDSFKSYCVPFKSGDILTLTNRTIDAVDSTLSEIRYVVGNIVHNIYTKREYKNKTIYVSVNNTVHIPLIKTT